MDPVSIVLLAAYAWLVIELTCFPVPCESSTYQLFFNTQEDSPQEDSLGQARRRPAWIKFAVYFLPTAIGVLLFVVPLIAVFWPRIIEFLLPVKAMHARGFALAGAALVIAGRSLTFASVLQLRAQRKQAANSAQTSGLFDYSRNPGLVGMYAFYLGNCLIFPSVVLFVGFVPYVSNMHRRVLMEESWLLRNGGESFRRYMERVPRYVPGL